MGGAWRDVINGVLARCEKGAGKFYTGGGGCCWCYRCRVLLRQAASGDSFGFSSTSREPDLLDIGGVDLTGNCGDYK